MFRSDPPVTYVGQQEFDPMTNSWQSSSRVVVPPPSQPATPMAVAQEEPEKKSMVKKMTSWLPFVD